jgi:hypothetical protein
VNATAAIAIIGAITTPSVAVAGYVFAYRSRSRDREIEATLAHDAHDHERKLAWASRAYDDKKSAYLTAMGYALVTIQRVALTEPLLTFAGQPEPPDPVDPDTWTRMHVEVGTFGSEEVDEALTVLLEATRDFNFAVGTFRTIKDQEATGTALFDSRQAMDKARASVTDAFNALRTAVNTDLRTL